MTTPKRGNRGAEAIWRPAQAASAATHLTRFTSAASTLSGLDLTAYEDLHRWSIQQPAAFWQLVWDFTQIQASQPPAQTVTDLQFFPGARWFPNARLNFAENLLRFRDDRTALISILETGERRELTYAELFAQTAAVAAHLKSSGIGPADRVVGWLPNSAETVIAMLATASLGAVWSSCSPDFGVGGALDRFGQIEPKILFACNGYTYNGKPISIVDNVSKVTAEVPSISQVIWVDGLADNNIPDTDESIRFTSILQRSATTIEFKQRAFDDPLYIMYSSGTTGKPKCIVHGIGGTLIQHLKEHQLHVDLKRDDTIFFFTTCGWMMWNWLVSSLATGATVVLYDGSPFHPNPQALLDIAERERVDIFGVSATYLSAIEKAGLEPRNTHNLEKMRCLLSTGSPLTHEGFRFVYRQIKSDVHLASISGGTDLISCFVLGNPTAPVWEGEIQCAGLGMAVEVFDDAGNSVKREKGELVCTQPFPSCPIGFWNDPDNDKFLDAYFNRYNGVWAHGDFAEITVHDGFVIHGRSDAVLNPGGVRIGTAEIYRQVEQIDAVLESICVGQEWDGDTRVILFVVMQKGFSLDEKITLEIRQRIRANASPRHMPAKILEVSDIPRTRSGKIVELAVRDAIHGRPVNNTSALANAEALEQFRDRPELAD